MIAMTTRKWDTTRLGFFVMTGAAILVFALFMIGRNTNLFRSNYTLTAHFRNVGGLREGNNVRFNGIEVGTVKTVAILDDTTVEVRMTIVKDMKRILRQDAICTIGTDGLIGNRVVNIKPTGSAAPLATEDSLLPTHELASTDEMMATLSQSNRNIAEITEKLKTTVNRINASAGLWKVLNDTSVGTGIKRSLSHIENAARHAQDLSANLDDIVSDVKAGKGTVGTLLRDSSIAQDLGKTVAGLKMVSAQAEQLASRLDHMAAGMDSDMRSGKGTYNLLLRDTAFAGHLDRSIQNIERGTSDFDEDMKALQQNILFRGYFRKKEKEKEKSKPSQ
jgi:phospholipid/cholesterol/gamma-HCH transport system substrate-binding protein